ncbi:MAG: hypothetical protein HY590_00160 [Candidatus Omnitrophica bacterium]|nr:hypothetical protein [Candidatus Omnitrophota bacterium]
MKEKGFLLLWIAFSVVFYAFLPSSAFAFVLRDFPLRSFLLSLFGFALLFLFSKKKWAFPQHPFFVFSVPLLLLAAFFLRKFPLQSFSSIIFQDDFTSLYAASLRTLRLLKEGALFGWDNHLLGGYYTVSDLNFNLGLFVWPFFLCFGAPVGYHLFIFILYLLFPLLLYALSRHLGGAGGNAAIAFWLASFFAISFFRNMLLWGNIDNLLGLDLFLLTLLALQKSGRNPRGTFWLSVLLVLLAYAHLAYFFYALFLVGFSLLALRHRKHLFYFFLVSLVVSAAVLPYAIHFLRNPHAFNLDAKRYEASPLTFKQASVQSLQKVSWLSRGTAWFTAGYEGVHGGNYGASAVLLSPFLLFLFWNQKKSRLLIGLIFLVLCTLPLKTGIGLALKRTYFLLPVLLSLVLAQGLQFFSERKGTAALIMVPALLLGTVGLPSPDAMPHQPTLEAFLPALTQKLKTLEGHTILLETQALWIETEDGRRGEAFPGPHVHMEMLLALETGKRYLSHGKDGYPFSLYRKNCLMSGIWGGKFLNQYSAEEVNVFLRKWGVRSIVVWSKTASAFFSAYPAFYEKSWEEPPWKVFRFKEADPRGVVLPVGKGEMVEERYTEMTIRLKGARKDDEAVLRVNYFPAFRAYCDGMPLSLYSRDGQIAFKVPREGDMSVTFRYPRYLFLSLIGLCGVALFAIFLWGQK